MKHDKKFYSEMNIIQKINVKGNARAYGERFGTLGKNFKAMNIAANDFAHFNYDTPFVFSGANPIY